MVTINPKWWPRNRGGLLVIPTEHYENVYDLPVALGMPLQQAIRDAAFTLKNHFTATVFQPGSTTNPPEIRTFGTTTSMCSPGTSAMTSTGTTEAGSGGR
ncbi:MAG: hypothetical protein M3535_11845, partial [Actinomycetota bacterium]|nr:hypothetical protein [Actinomycetota bacterium]